MSHFECRLNPHFWRSKKVVQVVQIGGRGRGGNLDKIQKDGSFFRDAFPNRKPIETRHWDLCFLKSFPPWSGIDSTTVQKIRNFKQS